ncbi:hypothetical protein M1446_00370 [Candidatus Dependentiae bacterium]|nr:hypothetical protein [Candidatus Dependentiae bacterium]
MLKTLSNRFWQILTFAILILMSKFVKLSFVLGSYKAFFTVSQFIAPLAGIFLGISGMSTIFSIRILSNLFLNKTFSIISLYHIPTFFASLYMVSENRVLKAAIPLIAMFLFVMHPVGFNVAWYSFYWLVPFAFAFIVTESIFIKCLATTLTAHCVGTVLYIYTVPSDINFWTNLAQFVWFERLVFALGMTVCYEAFNLGSSYISSFFGKKLERFL